MNRLAGATSPYLLQHAENPVDWYEWSDEAFERARAEDKPLLVSVGYSSCHWCHVMAHESFESETTAALMNELFVNVKVDREERPDVDAVTMEAAVGMTGVGRLADDGLHDAGREAVLRGHVLPTRASARHPELPRAPARGRRHLARAARRHRAAGSADRRHAALDRGIGAVERAAHVVAPLRRRARDRARRSSRPSAASGAPPSSPRRRRSSFSCAAATRSRSRW